MSKPERLDCLPESLGGMIGNAGTDRGNRFQFLLSFSHPLRQDHLVIGNNGSNPLLDQGKIIDDGGGFCRKYIGILEDQMLCFCGAELKNPVIDRFPLPKGEDFFPQFSLVLLGKKKGVPFTTSDNIQLLIQPGSLNFGEKLCRLRSNGGSPDD